MKFVVQVIATLVVCFLLQYFLPWWTTAIGAFAVSYFFDNGGFKSFTAGLLGVGLLWLLMAAYMDVSTDSILTVRVAKILPLHPFILTALIGGLVGGFASLTGALLKSRS